MVTTEAGREAIAVLTAKGTATILREGGRVAGSSTRRRRRCRWLVCTRNGHPDEWAGGTRPSRTARRSSSARSRMSSPRRTPRAGRLVRLDRYALADLPEAWQGWRTPCATRPSTSWASTRPGWSPGHATHGGGRRGAPFRPADAPPGRGSTATHDRGREQGLAATFGVPEEAIEITIRRERGPHARDNGGNRSPALGPRRGAGSRGAGVLPGVADRGTGSAWRSARGVAFRDLPESGRFIRGAYACGFVAPTSTARPSRGG